jgi:hypothetical protein
MNKTIYMTYKKKIPEFVFNRWKTLNPEYKFEFSLDKDCFNFLKTHFNDYIADLFNKIPIGMYKADLWRLCKLYIYGGVYADVDLVPFVNIDNLISNCNHMNNNSDNKNNLFCSCLCDKPDNGMFQAFIISSKPKNQLILHCLLSFLQNCPNKKPTVDMKDCIRYNLKQPIKSGIPYTIEQIKVPINIGTNDTNTKCINLHFFPNELTYNVQLHSNINNDVFNFNITDDKLYVTRIDANCGWEFNHYCDIIIDSKEHITLFQEKRAGPDECLNSYYIVHGNKTILHSRDSNYNKGAYANRGW